MRTSKVSQPAEQEAVARLLRERAAPIRDAWHTLILEHSTYGQVLQPELLDTYLSAFTSFIQQPDRAFPAGAAAAWHQRCAPNTEGVSATAVAIGLLPQAVRSGLEGVEDQQLVDLTLSLGGALLADYSGAFVRELMTTGDLSPREQHWYEVSRRLSEEREHKVTQLGIVNEVSAALAATLAPDELYQIIYEQCGRLLDTSNFYIATLADRPDEMVLQLLYRNGRRIVERERVPLRMGLTRYVVERAAPLMFDDYVAACRERGVEIVPGLDPSRTYAWVGVPIISGAKPIGVLAAMTERGPFDAGDAQILAAVARQAGAAIQNARLYEAQLAQTNRLRAINQLARTIATIREPGAVMQQACDLTRELFGYSTVSILMVLPNNDELELQRHSGLRDGDFRLGMRLPVAGPGLIAWAARVGQPALANDVSSDERYLDAPELADIRSELAVPIQREGVVLGVLDVQSPELGAFDEQDIETLATVADQLAVALENAELLAQESRRRTELALILEASRAANSSLVLDDVIQRVAEGIADAIGLPSCVVYLYDDEGDRLLPSAFVAREGSELDTTRVTQVIPTAETSQLLRRIFLSGHEASAIEMISCDVDDELSRVLCPSAVLAVPFVVKQQFLGLALLIAHDAEYHFSPHQLRVAYGIAGAAALALENARLYTRSHTLGVAEERIRVARDIHDGIAQGLTAVTLNLEATDQLWEVKPDRAHQKLGRALELTRNILEQARRSVLDLHASALQELTLTEAVQRRVQQHVDDQRAAGVTGSFKADEMYGRLSSRLELSLYRIFEEALDNVTRHAGATHVDVELARDGDDVLLRVSDNGHGFDAESVLSSTQPGGRFGLVAIRERVRLLHGTLQVTSAPGAGTSLQIRVPFEARIGDAAGPARQPAAIAETGAV